MREMSLELGAPPNEVVECEGVMMAPEFLGLHWDKIEKELDCIPHTWANYWTKQSMFESLMAGSWQAWGFGPAHVVRVSVFTTIMTYPIGRVLQILLAFGNSLDLVLPVMEATFERVAQETGCVRAELFGRLGWERKLRGFKRVAVVLHRDVEKQGVH